MAARTGNWIKRLELVEKAWKVLDKYNDGSVTMQDLMEVYDVSLHPDVFAGKITEEEAIMEFAKQWDHDKSGAITQNETVGRRPAEHRARHPRAFCAGCAPRSHRGAPCVCVTVGFVGILFLR